MLVLYTQFALGDVAALLCFGRLGQGDASGGEHGEVQRPRGLRSVLPYLERFTDVLARTIVSPDCLPIGSAPIRSGCFS